MGIIERNIEITAQAIIDIANKIISIEDFEKPKTYYDSIIILGKEGIIPIEFAKKLAPIAGLRNILIHEYLDIDTQEIYNYLKNLNDLYEFGKYIKKWIKK